MFGAGCVQRTVRVSVAAADVERAGQVVEFKLPAGMRGGAVQDSAGARLPLQVDEQGNARFVVPAQKAGEELSFTVVPGASDPGEKGVQVAQQAGQLVLSAGGAPAIHYQMDKEALPRADIPAKYKRAGYIHPVFTPSGKIVSDDYPAQHIHHHGIWAPWTRTQFQGRAVDFWNTGDETGTVEFVSLDRTWQGPVHGGFVARHRFVDLKAPAGPLAALHETWEVTVYRVAGRNGAATVFDLVSTQTTATADPLILLEYHYGGLGFRGRGEWLGKDKAQFLTSEGETDRVKAHTAKVRWLHTAGAVEGGVAGMAILGHPENFRAPQPMRVHPSEPFVCFAPPQGGEFRIEPGKPYVARYRFVVADGPPDRARLEAWWNGYATPARVNVRVE